MEIKDRPFEIVYKNEIAYIKAGDLYIELKISGKQIRKMYNWGAGGKTGSGTLSLKIDPAAPRPKYQGGAG